MKIATTVLRYSAFALVLALLTAARNAPPPPQASAAGPFASPSALPLQLPDFRQIKDADFAPAFEAGMMQQLREVNAIAHNQSPPSFENTLVALERSGQVLTRVKNVFLNLTQSNSDPSIEELERRMAPRLAAHQDAIYLNSALFTRIDTVYRQRERLNLDPESRQLIERYHTTFVRGGARLKGSEKTQLRRYNQQIATLTTQFQQTVLKASKDGAVVVQSAAELDGLTPEQIGAAASAAEARDLKGQWLIQLEHTTGQPVLADLKNRALRERIFRASAERGNGGADDTTATIEKLVRVRAQRARLLGYQSHAIYVLEEEEARTPGAVNELLAKIAPAALTAARHEAADIQALIDQQGETSKDGAFELQPWDWAFYANQVRNARYGFDEAQVKPYFELDRVLKEGVFYAAHELYGVTFTERTDLPAYEPSVRIFEMRESDGPPMALFIADYFARDNKQGGAWEQPFVVQSKLLGQNAVVVNNLNIHKPQPGQPVLLTFDEVTTLFHEFGHALHEMFSSAVYPTLAGTNVPADFVEYPSQFNEMWAREPKVLAHFACHYQTGEQMPQELFDKVLAAERYGQGFALTEYLAAAMLDQAWHQIGPSQVPRADQVMAFEVRALQQSGLAGSPVPPRYHSPFFLHAFSADADYSATYYAYLWSEVLARDTGQWLHEHGGLTRSNGDYLRSKVLSRGRTREPKDLFQDFYGKAPDIGPLLEYRGLSTEGADAPLDRPQTKSSRAAR
jgi:peptidyl-dipeptidase Dcp